MRQIERPRREALLDVGARDDIHSGEAGRT